MKSCNHPFSMQFLSSSSQWSNFWRCILISFTNNWGEALDESHEDFAKICTSTDNKVTYSWVSNRRWGTLINFQFLSDRLELIRTPRIFIFKKICSDQDVLTPDFKEKQLFGTSVIHF